MVRTAGRHRANRGAAVTLGISIALLLLAAVYFAVWNPIHSSSDAQSQPVEQTGFASPSSSGSNYPPATTATVPDTTAPVPVTTAPVPVTTAPVPVTTADGSLAPVPKVSPPPAAQPTSALACAPTHLSIPELGVDAAVVQIGLDSQGNLGTPTDADKKKAGWYPSALAGAARGSVILTGHTYHDESAIFRTDFNQKARPGMAVRLSCAGREALSYQVTEAKLDLGVDDYSAYVDSHRLYATDGPPQVLIITCTDWNPIRRDYDQRGILVAAPAP